jgi:hypothetical protein
LPPPPDGDGPDHDHDQQRSQPAEEEVRPLGQPAGTEVERVKHRPDVAESRLGVDRQAAVDDLRQRGVDPGDETVG